MGEFDIEALFLTDDQIVQTRDYQDLKHFKKLNREYWPKILMGWRALANAATIATAEGIIKQLKAHGRELEIQGLTKALQEAGYE